jgi:hypothetical protein
MAASVTVTNGAASGQLTVKLQTANGDPVGTPDVKVAAGGNTVVVINFDQRIVVTTTTP